MQTMTKNTKWFDYRPYSEEACSLFFIREWLKAREATYSRYKLDTRFDEEGKPYRLPVKWANLADLLDDDETCGLLNSLRAKADKRGMPYKMFWQTAFRVMIELDEWDTDLPAVSCNIILSSIFEYFEEVKQSRLLFSNEEFFQARNYTGHPVQFEYNAYLVAEIIRRHPADASRKILELVNEGRIVEKFALPAQPSQAIN